MHNRGAKIADAMTGAEVLTLRHGEGAATAVAWSPDSTRIVLASALDDSTGIWDATTGQKLLPLEGCEDGVSTAAWSPDGCHVAACDGPKIHLHDAASGAILRILTWANLPPKQVFERMAWSPDSTHLITAGETIGDGDVDTALVWNLASGIVVAVLGGHTGQVWNVTWAPDSHRAATAGDDRTARVWDARSGAELLVLRAREAVLSVAWSPDGTRLATGSADGTTSVWDASSGEELLAFGGLDGELDDDVHVGSVGWSPAGDRILTTSTDGRARIWDADSSAKTLVTKARARVHRSLTDTERHSFGLA